MRTIIERVLLASDEISSANFLLAIPPALLINALWMNASNNNFVEEIIQRQYIYMCVYIYILYKLNHELLVSAVYMWHKFGACFTSSLLIGFIGYC